MASIVACFVAPEVLPLVTSHDVEVVFLVEVFKILRVHAEREIAFQLVGCTIATIIESFGRSGGYAFVLRSLRNICAKCKVQAKVFKAMNLIVDVGTTHKRAAVSPFVMQSQCPNRVSGSQVVVGVIVILVIEETAWRTPLEITSEVVALGASVIVNVLRGVEAQSVANGSIVGIIRFGKHTLGVEVHRQVVVEKRGIEVQSCRNTLEIGSFKDTLLSRIAHRHAVRQVLNRTLHGHVMVVAHGRTINFFLPIGVSSAQCLCGIAACSVSLRDEIAIFVAVHQFERVALNANGYATVIAHLRSHALATFLRGDDDNTIRTARTVDSRGRSIFQDVERLDVLGVNHRQGVRQTLHAVLVHSYTIDNDKGIVRGVQRRTTTYTDARTRTGCTAIRRNVHTSHLTREHVLGVNHKALILRVGLQGCYRPRQVAFLHHAITNHHHFVQRFGGIVFHDDNHVGTGWRLCIGIADVRHRNLGACICVDAEVTVDVGNHSAFLSSDTHRSARYGFSGCIFHMSLHHNLLGKGTDGEDKSTHQHGYPLRHRIN